jgi:Arc/MetJ family transcription regulator
MRIMRTTVSIADELLAAAKRRARRKGQSLGSVIEDALRRELALAEDDRPRLEVPVFEGGTGPRAGIDLTSNRALHEALDEAGDLNALK